MRIVNRTAYSTTDLRRIFRAVLANNGKHEGPFRHKLQITVVYERNGRGVSGVAWLNTGIVRLRLHRPEHGTGRRVVAWLFEHELQHCRGYRHAAMGSLNKHRESDPEFLGKYYGYVEDGNVELAKPKAAKPKPDIQIVRYQRVMAQIEEKTRKAKRLANALKKLGVKRRYYERQLATDGRLAALRPAKGE